METDWLTFCIVVKYSWIALTYFLYVQLMFYVKMYKYFQFSIYLLYSMLVKQDHYIKLLFISHLL